MTDNDLFALVRGVVLAGLTSRGLPTSGSGAWDVVRNYPPEQEGGAPGPLILMARVGDEKRRGSPQQKYEWVADSLEMRATYYQLVETTLQFNVLMDESTDPAAYTPADVLSMVCDTLQTDEGMGPLRAAQVGVLPVSAVRNPAPSVNDRGQFAAEPSFDLVVTYRRTRIAPADYAVSIEGNIKRV